MNVRRVGVLIRKEFVYGSKSFFLIFAVVGPIAVTLLLNLIFGSIFESKPGLGIVDGGSSIIVESLKDMESIDLVEFVSEMELKSAVENGARDVGIVLPEGFDSMIRAGESTTLTAYIWGESLLKDRAVAASAVIHQIRKMSGRRAPVDIVSVTLGDEKGIPWKDRFLPIVVLMAIFISGFAVPSTSLVDEKERRTIGAVLTTPATQGEVFVSKGIMGITLSISMGIVTLILNHAFNTQLGLLVLILLLGAIMASCLGLIIGAFVDSMASMYTVIKMLGIILYGPGIVSMFPKIPQWLGKIFPTYYIVNPIMQIAREGGSWSKIHVDVIVLIGIIAALVVIAGVTARKTSQQQEA
jgi:ABC-2 type transport system permease protein